MSSRRTDNLAIASLISGITSLVCCLAAFGIVLGPAATTMGIIARRRINASDGALGGAWSADIGLVLGVVGFVASLVALYVFVFVLAFPAWGQLAKQLNAAESHHGRELAP